MKSGMIGAESVYEEIFKDEPTKDLANYKNNLKSSWLEILKLGSNIKSCKLSCILWLLFLKTKFLYRTPIFGVDSISPISNSDPGGREELT